MNFDSILIYNYDDIKLHHDKTGNGDDPHSIR